MAHIQTDGISPEEIKAGISVYLITIAAVS